MASTGRSTRLRAGRAARWAAAALLGLAALPGLLGLLGPGRADAATVALTDDDGGLALFTGEPALSPGFSRTACIALGARGLPADAAVLLAAEDVGGPLAGHLVLDVERGTGGRFGDCSGFAAEATVFRGLLSELASRSRATDGGLDTGWRPTAAPVATFRITASLAAATDPRGWTTTTSFVWRVAGTPANEPPSTGASREPPDLVLGPPVAEQVRRTLRAVLAAPQYTLVPLAAALLFLATQHLIDLRDPKLANASRTGRELFVELRSTYANPLEGES